MRSYFLGFDGLFVWTIPLVFLAISGCTKSASTRNGPLGSTDEIKLMVGNKETYAGLLGQHRGNVVLVDFWATWCGPCVQQFPHTVALRDKHRDQGLSVISVSMNEPGDFDTVLAFLKKRQAQFDHLLPDYGAGSQFLEAFDLRGDIPFYRLYDRSGTLRYSFSSDPEGIENCEDIRQLDKRVEQLLSENRN